MAANSIVHGALREWDNVVKDFCVYQCFSRKLNQPSDVKMKRDQSSGYLRSYLTDLSRWAEPLDYEVTHVMMFLS